MQDGESAIRFHRGKAEDNTHEICFTLVTLSFRELWAGQPRLCTSNQPLGGFPFLNE